jgi:hypothetical protein
MVKKQTPASFPGILVSVPASAQVPKGATLADLERNAIASGFARLDWTDLNNDIARMRDMDPNGRKLPRS